jgi:hypothetical protein
MTSCVRSAMSGKTRCALSHRVANASSSGNAHGSREGTPAQRLWHSLRAPKPQELPSIASTSVRVRTVRCCAKRTARPVSAVQKSALFTSTRSACVERLARHRLPPAAALCTFLAETIAKLVTTLVSLYQTFCQRAQYVERLLTTLPAADTRSQCGGSASCRAHPYACLWCRVLAQEARRHNRHLILDDVYFDGIGHLA